MKIENYFKELERKVKICYDVAEEAKKKGLDPKSKVEVPLATSLAGRVAGLISAVYPQLNNSQLVGRILELEKEHGNLDPVVCLKIAEEVAKEKFCKFKDLVEGIDAGIRIALAYFTLGVVSSPIEGYTHFKLKKTKQGKDYFSVYFSGPIRSAGGTAAGFSLVIVDYLREKFGFAKYDPTEEEVKRAITEIYDYHERITNLQYLPGEKEVEFLAKYLPIQVDGDPSEDKEVSNYKDLGRIETNFIRSGFCLVLGEGIAQKAPKILKIVNRLREKGFKLSDWDFLGKFVELQASLEEKKKSRESAVYIKDLVAGRPVLGHPSKSGAFRLRYGRARNSGYSCLAIHPATMAILDDFLAIGSQLKIEMPTKGCVVASCDSICGPIVKLKNGSVRKISDKEEAKNIYSSVGEILYLGDLLVPYGDFMNRNHVLMPAGYTEQEWFQELKQRGKARGERTELDNIYDVSFDTALNLSERFGLGLHPKFIFYWSQISYEQFLSFLDWLAHSRYDKKIILPYNKTEKERFASGKRALELLGVGHEVVTENVILSKEESKALLVNLGLGFEIKDFGEKVEDIMKKISCKGGVLEIINSLSRFEIKDKAGTFVGARMGRPEKAKLRKLVGSPSVLFPVGYEGGRLRSVNAACEIGNVKADFPVYFCKKCQRETIYFRCEVCGQETTQMHYCPECKQKFFAEKCPEHLKGQSFMNRRIDIKEYFDKAAKKIDLTPEEIPVLVKGVRGTSNREHIPENLAKGLLRSIFNLQVNKDGTIRFDATEMPLTHFKPKEIGTGIERLRELGYDKDIYGKDLENEEQILEILPHDIILPSCPDSGAEKADDVFVRVAHFIDSLLQKFYSLKAFYKIEGKEDLIGHLVACIAPHNCAGVVGRVIGFSKTQGLLASPYMHAAMRRDCDGDEAAVMLLLDLLINFSREYLPAHRGGTQDAPLVLNARIRAGEVDDMIFDFDIERELPLALYEAGRKMEQPSEVKISQIKDRIGKQEFRNLWYEYEVSDINEGALCSSYKRLTSMQEKVQKQMELVEKIRAANTGDVARLVIDRHFIRDIRGNLRKFSQQQFRCSKCNDKYRRPPLAGKCLNCGGNIIFTISEGSIVKYLEPAIQLAENYSVSEYIKQSLELTKRDIESIFGKEKEKQEALVKWF
jgi:DNA polymerase II large subunit